MSRHFNWSPTLALFVPTRGGGGGARNWGSKLTLKYSQTVADGAKLCIDSYRGLLIGTTRPPNSSLFPYHVITRCVHWLDGSNPSPGQKSANQVVLLLLLLFITRAVSLRSESDARYYYNCFVINRNWFMPSFGGRRGCEGKTATERR